MLVAVTVENWRGLGHVEVGSLGRANLVAGRGDAGKTSLLEAFLLALGPDAFEWIPSVQEWRWNRPSDPLDFEGTWQPVFRGGDVVRGIQVSGRFSDGAAVRWRLAASSVPRGWSLDWESAGSKGTIAPARKQLVTHPPAPSGSVDFWYVPARPGPLEETIALFPRLYEQGLDGDLLDWMRQANPALTAFHHEDERVRLATVDAPFPLALSCFGEGTLRAFEIGAALLSADPGSVVAIDDVETGFPDAVVSRLWRWIRRISVDRDLQVFATTRREASVEAACTAWREADDPDLRILRLERRDGEVKVAVLDRTLAPAR